jgi:hypothetical protein
MRRWIILRRARCILPLPAPAFVDLRIMHTQSFRTRAFRLSPE